MTQCNLTRLVLSPLNSTWLDLTWLDLTQLFLCDATSLVTTQCNVTCLELTQLDFTWLDSIWLDSSWLDSTWIKLSYRYLSKIVFAGGLENSWFGQFGWLVRLDKKNNSRFEFRSQSLTSRWCFNQIGPKWQSWYFGVGQVGGQVGRGGWGGRGSWIEQKTCPWSSKSY